MGHQSIVGCDAPSHEPRGKPSLAFVFAHAPARLDASCCRLALEQIRPQPEASGTLELTLTSTRYSNLGRWLHSIRRAAPLCSRTGLLRKRQGAAESGLAGGVGGRGRTKISGLPLGLLDTRAALLRHGRQKARGRERSPGKDTHFTRYPYRATPYIHAECRSRGLATLLATLQNTAMLAPSHQTQMHGARRW